MWRCASLSFLLALWGGCGGEKPETVSEPPIVAATGKPADVPGAAAPSVNDRQEELEFLRGLIGAYSQRVRTEKDKQEAMLTRHREEIAALGDLSAHQREERELTRTIRSSKNQIKHYEKKAGPADPAVKEVIDKLEALRALDEELTEQLEDLRGAFSRQMRMPELAETPVARDLKTIRAARDRWLADTTDARAKGAARARSAANKSFRSWLAEEEDRGRVVALALRKSSKKPKVERYDFTKIEFFLFCQLLEDELDRRNVAVEADLLGEQRKKEAVLVDKLDAIHDKITVIENSPEARQVAETEETLATISVFSQRIDLAQSRLAKVREALQAKRDLEKKQEAELEASQTALDEGKRLLADTKHKFDSSAKR